MSQQRKACQITADINAGQRSLHLLIDLDSATPGFIQIQIFESETFRHRSASNACLLYTSGIGGSGDFTRNAYISIFTCPSVAKEGKISAIVPMVSHLDHSEHSVNIIITEQGVADLRGKSPKERAEAIIENCAHPDYKQLLWDYLKLAGGKAQTPHAIQAALGMHAELAKSGDMKNTNWAEYAR